MRHPLWEQRLAELVAKEMNRPYEPGRHDCMLWPAAVVKAVTGKDYGRGHRGKYNNDLGATRYLKKLGFDSPEAMLDSLFEEKPIGFAGEGDLVLCEADNTEVPGVCMGSFALIVGQQGETEGLIRVGRERWLKAWAIGEHHSGKLPKPRKRRKKKS